MDLQNDIETKKTFAEKITLHPINAVVAATPKRMKLQGIPSVSLVFGSKTYQTRDLSGGYEHPKWNDIFECEIGDTHEIKVVLWDYDESNKQVTIGEGRISVNEAKSSGKDCFWLDILDNKKKVAKIFFDSEYISSHSMDKGVTMSMNPGYLGASITRSFSGISQGSTYIGSNTETTPSSRGESFAWN